MSDYDSSLPVRTESAGDVDAFISDPTIPSQKLKVNADGSIDTNATVTAGSKVIITDGADDLEVNADGSINAVVTATDLDIRSLDAASDSVKANLFDENGVAYSAANPLAVELASDEQGDEVLDYKTSAAIAAAASTDHDYTVTALKTFIGKLAFVAGSGKIKVEMFIDAAPVFTAFNSTSMPNIEIPLEKMLKASAGSVIKLTITNKDKQPQDVYSTLTGLEV